MSEIIQPNDPMVQQAMQAERNVQLQMKLMQLRMTVLKTTKMDCQDYKAILC